MKIYCYLCGAKLSVIDEECSCRKPRGSEYKELIAAIDRLTKALEAQSAEHSPGTGEAVGSNPTKGSIKEWARCPYCDRQWQRPGAAMFPHAVCPECRPPEL